MNKSRQGTQYPQQTRQTRQRIRWVLWATIGLNLISFYFEKTLIGIEYEKGTYLHFMQVWRHNNAITDINYIVFALLVHRSWEDVYIKVISSFFILFTVLMLIYNIFYSEGSTIMNLAWLAALFAAFCLTGFIVIRSFFCKE